MEFSSKLKVFEGVLNDDNILNDFYDVGSCTNSVIVEVGSANFCKKVQFSDNIREDLYSLCGQVPDVNVFVDAEEMVLIDDYASLLQVIDAGEEGFSEDGSSFLCDVVDGADDVDILISHWFYVFMLDDIREEVQEKQVKSFQVQSLEIYSVHIFHINRVQLSNLFQVEVEREAIHNEVHDGFLECSYINNGFFGIFLHVVMQSDFANQSEVNFGGLEAKMFQMRDWVFLPECQVVQPELEKADVKRFRVLMDCGKFDNDLKRNQLQEGISIWSISWPNNGLFHVFGGKCEQASWPLFFIYEEESKLLFLSLEAFQFDEEVNQIQYFLNGYFETNQFFWHTDLESDFKMFHLQMLILEIIKRHVLLVARLQVDNIEVFKDQDTELQNLVFLWKWFLYLGRFYEDYYADLKVEASCVTKMYQKAAVFVCMKSVMEEVSALEEVPSSLELPQVLKLANVFLHRLWFSGAQSTMLVGSFDSNQDAFEIIYGGGFLKLKNQQQTLTGLRSDHEVMQLCLQELEIVLQSSLLVQRQRR
ncbi:hypothetical protein L7F22_066699, partial [Adiantum nelumboides]|nr:hypothetical protein [Adiantum nelumboides]